MYNTRFIQILKIMTWRRQWEGDTKTHTGTSFEVKLNDYKSPTGNISYIVCGIHTAQHERHFYNKIPTYWYTVSLYRYLWVTFLPKFYNYLNIYGRICQNCDKIIHMCYL